jgi:hypothetical protein
MSSGRRHPWAGTRVPAGGDGLVSGSGVAVVEEAGGMEVFEGDEEVGLLAVPEGGADGGPDADPDADPDAGPDAGPDVGPDGGADVLGWAGRRGASCRQAAMTTRLPDWSALPPTPLRSTK